MKELHKTARYAVLPGADGNHFRFFCGISGAAVCTTGPIRAPSEQEELDIAWNTGGKQQFNHCSGCGRWVSDMMYNADVCKCVDCAPWENAPRYCSHCGKPSIGHDIYCRGCGARLRYGEVWA